MIIVLSRCYNRETVDGRDKAIKTLEDKNYCLNRFDRVYSARRSYLKDRGLDCKKRVKK
jgi:hypothetical protein